MFWLQLFELPSQVKQLNALLPPFCSKFFAVKFSFRCHNSRCPEAQIQGVGYSKLSVPGPHPLPYTHAHLLIVSPWNARQILAHVSLASAFRKECWSVSIARGERQRRKTGCHVEVESTLCPNYSQSLGVTQLVLAVAL